MPKKKMLFDGALLPVVVQVTVGSPEGDVYVHTDWCLFLVVCGFASCFSVPQLGDAFKETIRFGVYKNYDAFKKNGVAFTHR